MAYTKIHPIKSTLEKSISYICNPDKTDGKLLISTFRCAHETADIQFGFSLDQVKMRKGDNLAHHLIQSFDPSETTPEQAHEIGQKLADQVTGNQHEYVLTTHIDRGHIHNHILFCAANFITHKKYISNKRTYYKIRSASDKLCREYSLSTIIPSSDKGIGAIEYTTESGQRTTRPAQQWAQSWTENDAAKRGTSWKENLRNALDHYIGISTDLEDMLRRMEVDGFVVKRAKYHSYKLPNSAENVRFTGGPSLGPEYTDERIKERIIGLINAPKHNTQRHQQHQQHRPSSTKINLLIDIENNIKAQQSVGYARKLQVINLKEAAKTLNYLTEHNITHYGQLLDRITDVTDAHAQTLASLKAVESRIKDMALFIKNAEIYKSKKPIFDQYRQAKNKDRFRAEHESDLIIFEAAHKAIMAEVKPGEPLKLAAIRSEYKQLVADKDRLYVEYAKLGRQIKDMDRLKKNVDSILETAPPIHATVGRAKPEI